MWISILRKKILCNKILKILRMVIFMDWILENNQTTPLDACAFNFCWTNDESGACGIQLCGKRFCIERY